MTESRVVHVKDNIPGAIYIGRANPRNGLKASKWANPYKIGDPLSFGPDTEHLEKTGQIIDRVLPTTRIDVLNRYEEFLQEEQPELIAELAELRGKPLACWCRHDGEQQTVNNLCHGDVLLSLLKHMTDAELEARSIELKKSRDFRNRASIEFQTGGGTHEQ